MMSVQHVIEQLYPYDVFLGKEGRTAVKDALKVSIAYCNSRKRWIMTVVLLTNASSLAQFEKTKETNKNK